jgi:cytochrome c peroxidase
MSNTAIKEQVSAALVVAFALLAPTPLQAQPTSRPSASSESGIDFSPAERRLIARHSPLPPPPPDPTNAVADDPDAAHLGQYLFFDTRLSGNGALSCASCHQPDRHFADGKPLAEGIASGIRHTPSLWNVAHNRWFFWDGRADTLWAQALEPLERSDEMGGSRLAAAQLLVTDPDLKTAYERVFGEIPDAAQLAAVPGTADLPANVRTVVDRIFVNIGKAISAYQRKLVSRRAPFDVFAEGLAGGDPDKTAAISPSAQRGLKLFLGRANCRLCHSGPTFSDGEFHSVRVPDSGSTTPRDPARYDGVARLLASPFNAAGSFSDDTACNTAGRLKFLERRPADWGLFKTPTLRNVAVTAPYMHQGQLATLAQVIEHYSTFKNALPAGHHDIDRTLEPLRLTPEESADLLAFLESLTDTTIDPSLLRQPESPLRQVERASSPRKQP